MTRRPPQPRLWVHPDPVADYERPEPRTITVHEGEPVVDTGILDAEGRPILRRAMGPVGFLRREG